MNKFGRKSSSVPLFHIFVYALVFTHQWNHNILYCRRKSAGSIRNVALWNVTNEYQEIAHTWKSLSPPGSEYPSPQQVYEILSNSLIGVTLKLQHIVHLINAVIQQNIVQWAKIAFVVNSIGRFREAFTATPQPKITAILAHFTATSLL
jgi:hypothetical protein